MTEKQHTPILMGLRTLVTDREWEVEVVPLFVGQRSVQKKEWLETLKIFGIGKEDVKRIITETWSHPTHGRLDLSEYLDMCHSINPCLLD